MTTGRINQIASGQIDHQRGPRARAQGRPRVHRVFASLTKRRSGLRLVTLALTKRSLGPEAPGAPLTVGAGRHSQSPLLHAVPLPGGRGGTMQDLSSVVQALDLTNGCHSRTAHRSCSALPRVAPEPGTRPVASIKDRPGGRWAGAHLPPVDSDHAHSIAQCPWGPHSASQIFD